MNHNFVYKVCLLLFLGLLPACNQAAVNQHKETLLVYAGISLTESFQKLEHEFELANDVNVQISFDTGQRQLEQLRGGATPDIFVTANQQQMLDAISNEFVVSGSQRLFARNSLVVITPKENPGRLYSFKDLSNSNIRLVIGADSTAVGAYTISFLENARMAVELPDNFVNRVIDNIVSYEASVKAVVTKTLLNEADAGIVFFSDYFAERESLDFIEIPDYLNIDALYYIAPIKNGKNPESAADFIDFVLSSTGRDIIQSYGFLLPSN